MIAVHDVCVQRGAKTLVHSVNLRVPAGEVVALVGPNGAGKSTLLKVMSADLTPSSGTVTIGDRPLGHYTGAALAQLRAVVPQHATLDFDFQVHEVVTMGRAPWHGASATSSEFAVVEGALALVGLSDLAGRSYPSLSGGEQQRVHMARALAQLWPSSSADASPRGVLLLDEPVASLDPQHQHRTLQLARAVAATGVAVLVVLHDLNLAVQYADHIALLCGGRLRSMGPAHSVLNAELLSDVYGTPFDVVPHPCADCPLVVARPTLTPMRRRA